MIYLKQSTAVTLKIGQFLDETDGKTIETGLTITQADVRLSKNGGDIAQKTEVTACTHDELGIYGCPIDATDTNTLGRLQLWVHESGALPVWHEFVVVAAHIYDTLIAATDKLEVNVVQLNTVAQSLIDLKDFADAGYDPATNKVQGVVLVDTTSTNIDMVGTNGANTTTPPTVAQIKTKIEEAGSKLAVIETDTNELQTDLVDGGRLDALFDRILKATEIKQASVAAAGATTTVFISSLSATSDDFWNRSAIIFTSGQCEGQMRKIHDYNGTSKQITMYTALSYAPANGDTFIIVAARNFRTNLIDNDAIVDGVCDELLADHTVAGSLAKAVSDTLVDTNDLQGNQGAWATATGFNVVVPDAAGVVPTAVEIQTQIEGAGSKILAIETDTNELQTDWKDTGRLDTLLDAIPTTAMRGTDGANTTIPDAAGVIGALLAPMQTDLDSLTDEIGGKWEVVSNQMIFYKSDNTTEIMRFNLFDAAGNPAIADVVKRERV